ncbi:MAG: DedA family protein [Haloarculaceae archaeon]
MALSQGLAGAVLGFVAQYGLFAVFVYMLLETALLLHFVPSELVVPVAAAQLVTGPASFAVFVAVAAAGGTLGAFLAYAASATFGREALGWYGGYLRITPAEVERGDRWFRRWGETSVFWGRLLPFVRAFISVPAGLAAMDRRRFLAYTAAGTVLYVGALTAAVYTGFRAGGPLRPLVRGLRAVLALDVAYVRAHPLVVGTLLALALGVALWLWARREWIRAHPAVAKRRILRVGRAVGVAVGLLFVSAALAVPDAAYRRVIGVWNDPRVFVAAGASKQLALVLTGIAVIAATLLATLVLARLPLASLARRRPF